MNTQATFPAFDLQFHKDKKVVIIHHFDQDGYVAAAITQAATAQNKHQLFPVQYGDAVPEFTRDKDTIVYVVDFSFSREVLEQLNSEVGLLVVLDHHEGTREFIGDLPYVHISKTRAGAGTALDYFFPSLADTLSRRDLNEETASLVGLWQFGVQLGIEYDPMQSTISQHQEIYHYLTNMETVANLVDNYDLWNRDFIEAFEFFEGVETALTRASVEEKHEFWTVLLRNNILSFAAEEVVAVFNPKFTNENGVADLIGLGRPIYSHLMDKAEGFAKKRQYAIMGLDDSEFIDCPRRSQMAIYNITDNRNYTAEAVLVDNPQIAFTLSYRIDSKGKVIVSLRSSGEYGYNVSKLAQRFKGNGHHNAAAFTMSTEQFFHTFYSEGK